MEKHNKFFFPHNVQRFNYNSADNAVQEICQSHAGHSRSSCTSDLLTVIESTTEISSLEGTSRRETASTSAHRVPNTLIADYGKEREEKGITFHLVYDVTGMLQ